MQTEEEIEELENLRAVADEFTSKIFDWVSCLGRVDFLHQCYDFNGSIDKRIAELKAKPKPEPEEDDE